MRLAARFISIFLAVILMLFVSKPVFAQDQASTPIIKTQNFIVNSNNPNVPLDMNTYTQSIMLSFMGGLGCQLAGYNPVTQNNNCLGYDKTTGKFGYVDYKGGLVGFLGNQIAVLYTPPIHTSQYIQHLASNFGIVKTAHAQYGNGLDSLYPISGLFVVFRNIAYFLFVVIFIFIGLGIMLRLRIDPRTVMSIQNQIPKVIIGLILVTLSFAIAGLVIDGMWVLTYLFINTFQSTHSGLTDPGVVSANSFTTTFSLSGIIGNPLGIANATAGSFGDAISSILKPETMAASTGFQGFVSQSCNLNLIPPSIDLPCILQQAIGSVIGFVAMIVAWLVVIIAVIVSLFRLWFALLKAYILAIFDIIFAPFWIVAGLFPRASPGLGFGAWLRDLIGNLLPFPVVIGLFMLAKIIADGLTTSKGNFFFPWLLGGPDINIGGVIAFGIVLWSPSVVTSIKNMLKASGPGGGMGGVSTGLAAVAAVGGIAKRRAYWRDSSGQTHGLAAEWGRAAGRRVSNSGVGQGTGNFVSNFPVVGRLRRNLGYLSSHQVQTAEGADYTTAMNVKKKGGSVREAENAIDTARQQRSNANLAQAISPGIAQPSQVGAPLAGTQPTAGAQTVNAQNITVNAQNAAPGIKPPTSTSQGPNPARKIKGSDNGNS